ncbi:response regulator transcription factor [Sorangium sp. So ce136]|uniref:response regulator transcription factor n=1 Tax=Sorangium sp. So ce136 TaxID=3133284 RepID=UPI003EFE5446
MTPPRVLVAEDEPAMLSLVARHLRNMGFSVIEASEGDAAWDLAREHQPDLVILDVMMPGMSGWEICKRLKGDTSDGRPFANTGVIMLTGIGENLNEMTSPLFAADAWLNKPFDFAELDARVRETLARYAKQLPGANGGKGQVSAEGEEREAASQPSPRAQPSSGARASGAKKSAANGAGAAAHKAAAQKPAASKKAAAQKPAAPKKGAAQKPAAVKKAVAQKPAAVKKAVAQKSAASKKAVAQKPAASKKAAAQKPVAPKKGAAQKSAAKPAAAPKKTAAKSAAPQKPAAAQKSAAPQRSAAKPAAAKKAAATKAAPKKKTAK